MSFDLYSVFFIILNSFWFITPVRRIYSGNYFSRYPPECFVSSFAGTENFSMGGGVCRLSRLTFPKSVSGLFFVVDIHGLPGGVDFLPTEKEGRGPF